MWKANRMDKQTNPVIIVHTWESCKILIPSLLNIVVIDKFNLYVFQFDIDCDYRQISML